MEPSKWQEAEGGKVEIIGSLDFIPILIRNQ
jgi:hypothetical protein